MASNYVICTSIAMGRISGVLCILSTLVALFCIHFDQPSSIKINCCSFLIHWKSIYAFRTIGWCNNSNKMCTPYTFFFLNSNTMDYAIHKQTTSYSQNDVVVYSLSLPVSLFWLFFLVVVAFRCAHTHPKCGSHLLLNCALFSLSFCWCYALYILFFRHINWCN